MESENKKKMMKVGTYQSLVLFSDDNDDTKYLTSWCNSWQVLMHQIRTILQDFVTDIILANKGTSDD